MSVVPSGFLTMTFRIGVETLESWRLRFQPAVPLNVYEAFWPGVVVGVVGIGDDRVDAVIAAVQRDDDQNAGALGHGPFVPGVEKVGQGECDDSGQQSGRSDTGARDQELAPIELCHLVNPPTP